jgi:hypothetical protein
MNIDISRGERKFAMTKPSKHATGTLRDRLSLQLVSSHDKPERQ